MVYCGESKRDTFGWIIYAGCYMLILLSNQIGISRTNSIGKVSDCSANIDDSLPNSEEAIRRGEYAVIRSLTRVLEVLGTVTYHFLLNLSLYFVQL